MTPPRPAPLFTILLPIHRPPDILPCAVESIRAQQCKDFELFIICDGAPAETVSVAEELTADDARLHVRSFPKGERNGEAHRHHVITQESRGTFICQIADDDLWMPHFLNEMRVMLEDADFGTLANVNAHADGSYRKSHFDLSVPELHEIMLHEKFNWFGPTTTGYRRSAYDTLPGWTPAPQDIYTDLFMWRKFLRQSGLRFATRQVVASLHFPSSQREQMSIEHRAEENAAQWKLIRSFPDETALREYFDQKIAADWTKTWVTNRQQRAAEKKID